MTDGDGDAAPSMTTPVTEQTPEPTTTARPTRRVFRPARVASRLSGDEAEREGRIVRIAFARLGTEAARVFLNTPHEGLGGRPLDLATSSADGAAAVEQAIAAMPQAVKVTPPRA